MKKRYWNDLSDKEIEKMEDEWENSKWYERAYEEAKKQKPNSTEYYLCVVGAIFFSIPGLVLIIKDNIDSGYKLLGILFGIITIICCFFVVKEAGETKNNYIDEQFNKWLLDKYNIIK